MSKHKRKISWQIPVSLNDCYDLLGCIEDLKLEEHQRPVMEKLQRRVQFAKEKMELFNTELDRKREAGRLARESANDSITDAQMKAMRLLHEQRLRELGKKMDPRCHIAPQFNLPLHGA